MWVVECQAREEVPRSVLSGPKSSWGMSEESEPESVTIFVDVVGQFVVGVFLSEGTLAIVSSS